jgi:hypothetical protein
MELRAQWRAGLVGVHRNSVDTAYQLCFQVWPFKYAIATVDPERSGVLALQGCTVVFTAVNIKTTIFWDVAPYGVVEREESLGGTYCVHPRGRSEI